MQKQQLSPSDVTDGEAHILMDKLLHDLTQLDDHSATRVGQSQIGPQASESADD